MFNWFKRLLGVAHAQTTQETLVLENPVVAPTAEKPQKAAIQKPKTTTKATQKKSTTKKAPVTKTTEAPKKRGRPKKSDS